ncbi:MAG: DUF222 domain-containing protein, partial [Pseudonocardiaceae bacterium]
EGDTAPVGAAAPHAGSAAPAATPHAGSAGPAGSGSGNGAGWWYQHGRSTTRRRAPIERPPAMLNWETPLIAEAARRIACDANLVPIVLGSDGQPLAMGRAVRTATKAQRRALALRDHGCVFDGCTRPVRWTQAHHIAEWDKHNGATNIDNMCQAPLEVSTWVGLLVVEGGYGGLGLVGG